MKNIYFLFLFIFSTINIQAQIDTILFEDFQLDILSPMDTMSTGADTSWVNFDQDGLPTAFGTNESQKWFHGEFFINALDPNTGITNYIATSLSFLSGFLPGNRNWLILPPIEVMDDSYLLHWKSAPAQLPRYMDGYSVVVSTGGNDPLNNDFTDTLFRAASMDQITGISASTDYSNFTFTPGYLHADGGTLLEYIDVDPAGETNRGLLEPHSIDLLDYEGQTIYIAFLHDADDDERIGLDDILITRSEGVNTNDLALQQLRMETYPNPVDEKMNLTFRLKNKNQVSYQIQNTKGQIIVNRNLGELETGPQKVQFYLSQLPAGIYFLNLQVGDISATQSFVKK